MSPDEDVHMTDEVETGPDYQVSVTQYIVVDTNILIHRLPLVKALFQVLSLSVCQPAVHLLIPSMVIHELDNIQKSDRAEIRDQAKEAMRYLLKRIVSRRSNELIPLRVQKQSEVLRERLTKPDDRILDCCLYFKPACERIWLWTRDLNLNVAAESNDVHMLPSRTLDEIVDAIGFGRLPEVQEELRRVGNQRDDESPEEGDGGMEFDIDLDQELPSFELVHDGPAYHLFSPPIQRQPSGTLLDDYLFRYPPLPPSGDVTPLSPSSASSSQPRSIINLPSSPSGDIAMDQYEHLIVALQPLLRHLDVMAPTSDRHLTSLHDRLRATEKAVESGIAARQAPTDEQRILLEGISATRTLARYFERSLFDRQRKPRKGQVVDAIEDIANMCQALTLGDSVRQDLLAIATRLRAS